MALSNRNRPVLHFVVLILAAFGAGQAGETIIGNADETISLVAKTSDFDAKTNKLVFYDVDISQGDNSIHAERAEGTELEFENSQWEFFGDVNIKLGAGSIRADEATLTFVSHRLKSAVIRGSPAEFEQQLECRTEVTQGHANEMNYDFEEGLVQLVDQAWLKEGQREISGAKLTYSLRDERVLAMSDDSGETRVEIVIQPGGNNTKDACPEPTS